ncbi:MAG: T9SS type B sorting domain-containing protein [Bacteroidia bacterium]
MKKIVWLFAAIIAISIFSCSKDADTEPNTDLFIPRAFTPDGDGVNDSFIIKGTNIEYFKIEIFDEAKTKVYISDEIKKGWDGRYKNQTMPAGNYLWVIEYIKTGKPQQKQTGYVELIR